MQLVNWIKDTLLISGMMVLFVIGWVALTGTIVGVVVLTDMGINAVPGLEIWHVLTTVSLLAVSYIVWKREYLARKLKNFWEEREYIYAEIASIVLFSRSLLAAFGYRINIFLNHPPPVKAVLLWKTIRLWRPKSHSTAYCSNGNCSCFVCGG